MLLDNYRKTVVVKLRRFVIAIIIMLLIVLTLMTSLFDFFEYSEIYIPVISGSLYFVFYSIEYYLNYNYIYFNNEGKKFIFRFYSMRIFRGVKKAIEIPKGSLVKYDVKKVFFNMKTLLILYQQYKNETIKYPPINITLLGKEEKQTIYSCLNKYIKK